MCQQGIKIERVLFNNASCRTFYALIHFHSVSEQQMRRISVDTIVMYGINKHIFVYKLYFVLQIKN